LSFAEDVLSATDRRGVDVVLNSLSGAMLQASFNVLAPFGHFVEIGKSDLERNSNLEMRPFARHASFSSVDLLAMMRYRSDDIRDVLVEVAHLAAHKIAKPVHPVTVYPMSDVAKAFRLLQTGRHSGKVVLEIRPDESVPVLPHRPSVRLSPNASYLLVGGVGGVGRSMANWLVERGAKHLILLSRSAGDKEKTGSFVEQLSSTGCRVKAISCDVADARDLGQALSRCELENFPPVRGVIQGAMVLKVRIRGNFLKFA
jgi:NADPH:quinone reductase-like Zn-dependent oxidoreductase